MVDRLVRFFLELEFGGCERLIQASRYGSDSDRRSGRVRLRSPTLETTMQTVADRPEAPNAIRNDLGAIFISLELSRSTWLITSLSPDGGEKMSKHSVPAGDIYALLARFSEFKQKAFARTGKSFPIIVIQEAGLDGFLSAHEFANRRAQTCDVIAKSVSSAALYALSRLAQSLISRSACSFA